MEKPEKKPDHTFNIILLGDAGVGKTNFLSRFLDGTFKEENEIKVKKKIKKKKKPKFKFKFNSRKKKLSNLKNKNKFTNIERN